MSAVTRRTFLRQTTGAIAATTLGAGTKVWASSREAADLVLRNGVVVTIDEQQPLAEALAVRGKRIMAVGTNSQIDKLVDHGTKVVDLAGQSLSPGLIDAHSHLIAFGHMQLNLEAFAAASGGAAECRRRRHRIEHYPFRKLDTIARTAEMGVPVCVQPNFIEVKAEDFREKLGANGENYVETMVPLR